MTDTAYNRILLQVLAAGSLLAQGTVTSTYTLPDIPLGQFQNSVLPGTITNDRNFLLGGVGSGLWRHPEDGPNIYWMVTDRGANGLVQPGSKRTFPVPAFTPFILRVRAEQDGSLAILDRIPITGLGASLNGVTGLSNTTRDETPYNCNASATLPFNPNGLDTEDLVRTHDGAFWLVEEYSPSIVKLDSTGRVEKRFIPAGVVLAGTDYVVSAVLPAIYGAKRKRNRGFEGLAITPNQKTLIAALQSPLSNPTSAVGNASRNTRLLLFDIESELPVAEYVYRFQPSTEFAATDPAEMKVSAVVALDEHRLLVLERTDAVAKIYRVDLRRGTNILGSRWDDLATSPSLEALSNPAAAGVTVLPKDLVIDLSTVPGVPQKIEGLAVLDDGMRIAISNDNDFDVGTFDANCNNVGAGAKSKILEIRLDAPLRK
ncbi:MAG: esterase-like activity of phytase family protein [Candidatus Solibacter usitatus]|nr:esterase-like activity of phytase family protein [Candidatus Solibacter usitatus]